MVPLRRVLITRPAAQARALCELLKALGIDAIAIPTVAIHPPHSYDALDHAVARLSQYDWIIFTSVNGVRSFFERQATLGHPVERAATRWAAIGPATSAEMTARGIPEVWMPTRYLSAALAEELPEVSGRRILRIRADIASTVLTERLRARGGLVDDIIAYRTLSGPPETRELLVHELARGVDAVVFTSASTVQGFARALGSSGGTKSLQGVALIAIGPVTAAAIKAHGWQVDRMAAEHSVAGIVRIFQERM